MRCSGCGHEMFAGDGDTPFQRDISEIMAFTDFLIDHGMASNEWSQRYAKYFGGTDKHGVHAVLAEDCSMVPLARHWRAHVKRMRAVEKVMES